MDKKPNSSTPTTVEVDFRSVGIDGRVTVTGLTLSAGMSVEAFDGAGNRCRAKVVEVRGEVAELDLVMSSFRTSGE